MEDLVSIITPCYNGEKYLTPYLESILNQTYDDIELIFVDDGSTDNSANIIADYKDKFLNRGYELKYLYQKNQGQAEAINTGLAKISGEFIMWIDCDDILHPDNAEKKANILKNNKDLGFVLCNGESFYDYDFSNRIFDLDAVEKFNQDSLFEDLIFGKNHVIPGLFMARTVDLFKVIPKKRIYTSRIGQNMQLLLPLSYGLKCGVVDKMLFYYRIHSESHFRSVKTALDWLERLDSYLDCLTHVINDIKMPELYRIDILSRLRLYVRREKFLAIYNAYKNKKEILDNDYERTTKEFLNIEEIKKRFKGRGIIIWGATDFGVFVASKLESLGFKVKGFIDKEFETIKNISGYEVNNPNYIVRKKYYIVIPLLYHEDIISKLNNANYMSIRDYWYPHY